MPLEPLDTGSVADATVTRELPAEALVPSAGVGQAPRQGETLPAAGQMPQRPEAFTQPDPRVQPHPQVQPLPQQRAAQQQARPQAQPFQPAQPQTQPQPQPQAHPQAQPYPPASTYPSASFQPQPTQPQHYATQQAYPPISAPAYPGQQAPHHYAPAAQPYGQPVAQPIQQGFPQQFPGAPVVQPYAQTPFGPPAYVQMVPRLRNSPATAALTLGIICLVFLITIIGFVFVPILSILSTIFACIGISIANKMNGFGKGKAITGLVLGLVPLAILVLVFWGSSIS